VDFGRSGDAVFSHNIEVIPQNVYVLLGIPVKRESIVRYDVETLIELQHLELFGRPDQHLGVSQLDLHLVLIVV
jgi:hypothetical protein